MISLSVEPSGKCYPIQVKPDLLSEIGQHLKVVLASSRVCVVTDENVARHYLMPLMKNMEEAGLQACPPIILPAGEETKNIDILKTIIDRSLEYRLDRKSALIALGGGVVGDITGFAASILLRGIGFIQVPTTLLSQVDSSVGGKTGINTPQGKNLIGSFYQPDAVFIDPAVLSSLPARELKAGYAEILKYALIDRPDFFDWLERHGKSVLALHQEAVTHAIIESCKAKAKSVAADEHEKKGVRALLNLGHTFGHALESLGNYDGRLLHGEAVSIGMMMAFDFSVREGLCPSEDARRLRGHLEGLRLPLQPPFPVTADDMIAKMKTDKKSMKGRLTLVLARGIGKSFVAEDVSEHSLKDFLTERLQHGR